MKKIDKPDALGYHELDRPGKIEVVPTKPTATQRDLSLAYTPGVAHPCREIHQDPMAAYRYTARGNLVAVISNGTAVLGLGDIGALAGKPVMEGKGVLFKKFADLDVFDLEVDTHDVEEIIRTVKLLEPTFGGINLEDIKAPECFEIERRLKAEMQIPVFHDDQHGTAIISAAALLNALVLAGKRLEDARIVFSGAGAAAVGCSRLYAKLGADPSKMTFADSKGIIYRGRREGMTALKEELAVETAHRTLAEALVGADVCIGLSVKGQVTPDMVRSMANDPIVFAMANPDPEITWDAAVAARSDVIMATGRSDYPNQVNNVLGFPFIFRGALDVLSTDINDAMVLAAVKALAALAQEDVPDSVLKAYGVESMRFGRTYLIPKPFDRRVLTRVAPAVAKAAIDTGVARRPIEDWAEYRRYLETLISRRLEVMHDVIDRAKRAPKRLVFPEGEHPKILRAAKVLVDEGIAHPILVARRERIGATLDELELGESDVTIVQPDGYDRFDEFVDRLHARRQRNGVTRELAGEMMLNRNYFGSMMVATGDADGLLSGLTQHYPETIRPALRVIGTRSGVRHVSGAYIMILEDRVLFFADTTVNIEPDSETLAEIAVLTAELAARFQLVPRVAMLSFSNFGSNKHPQALKVRRAVADLRRTHPELVVDGEMQADTAVAHAILRESYPFSNLDGPPNVLVFPELNSANIAYKLVWRLAKAEAVGPVLLGMDKPVHVLQRGVDVADIVNMAAICVTDVHERERRLAG